MDPSIFGGIFKYKVDKILGGIQAVKMNIDDIIFLENIFCQKHMEHIRFVLSRLRHVGLKINSKKCSF